MWSGRVVATCQGECSSRDQDAGCHGGRTPKGTITSAAEATAARHTMPENCFQIQSTNTTYQRAPYICVDGSSLNRGHQQCIYIKGWSNHIGFCLQNSRAGGLQQRPTRYVQHFEQCVETQEEGFGVLGRLHRVVQITQTRPRFSRSCVALMTTRPQPLNLQEERMRSRKDGSCTARWQNCRAIYGNAEMDCILKTAQHLKCNVQRYASERHLELEPPRKLCFCTSFFSHVSTYS